MSFTRRYLSRPSTVPSAGGPSRHSHFRPRPSHTSRFLPSAPALRPSASLPLSAGLQLAGTTREGRARRPQHKAGDPAVPRQARRRARAPCVRGSKPPSRGRRDSAPAPAARPERGAPGSGTRPAPRRPRGLRLFPARPSLGAALQAEGRREAPQPRRALAPRSAAARGSLGNGDAPEVDAAPAPRTPVCACVRGRRRRARHGGAGGRPGADPFEVYP